MSGAAAARREALLEAARGLEWDYVRSRLLPLVDEGLARLGGAGRDPVPRELHLELTHRCDLKCAMCEHWQVEHLDPGSVARELDFAALRRAVEGAQILREVSSVVVTGGEPWLRHDLVDVLCWLRGRFPRAELIVLTNFWNTGNLLRRLAELRARGVSRLRLGSSLDGLEATHDRVRGQEGAFRGLTRTVEAVRRDFPEFPFGFTFTITPDNASELNAAYLFVTRDLGSSFGCQWVVETCGIEPVRWPPGVKEQALAQIRGVLHDLCRRHDAARRAREGPRPADLWLWSELLYWHFLEEYGRAPRRFEFFTRCTAGERHVMLDPEGDVFYCPVNRNRVVGSVRESPLDAVWASARAEEERGFVASGRCHCWLRCVSTPALDRLLTLALASPPHAASDH